jgi:hypothetical protein
MRWITGAVLALVLSGCGEESDDFSVYVKRSPDAVINSLSQIDVTQPSALVTKPIRRTLSDGGIIEYAIPAAEGHDDGIVRLTVLGNAKNGTKVAVMVDVPAVKGYVDGGQKVVAEEKVEAVLKKDLQAWAKNLQSGNAGELATARVEASLMSVAVVLQNISGTGLMERGGVNLASSFFDGGADDGEWASSDNTASNASPMSDPDADASSYGEPTDDGAGYDDDGGWAN